MKNLYTPRTDLESFSMLQVTKARQGRAAMMNGQGLSLKQLIDCYVNVLGTAAGIWI